MTSSPHDLGLLIEQIRCGSESASVRLVAQYGTHILRIVRHKLSKSLRPKFDSQDFVQAVWASFFALLPERGEFARPEDLVAFLTELARNKVVDEIRLRLQTQKFNVNRERSLDLSTLSPQEGLDSRQPAPDDVAIAREEWQRLLAEQPAHYRRILELLRAGNGRIEIARELGVSEKTVRRVIQKLSPRLGHENS